jgi:putative ABC transport system substrate-binding protein
MRRREFIAAAAALLPDRHAAAAGIHRVGILSTLPRGREARIAREFAAIMGKLGFVEGRDVEYLHRNVETGAYGTLAARLEEAADELVRARPDAIVTSGTFATTALARATATIPIVTNVGDPVRAGFAKSIARPGGNVTGLALAVPEVYEKTFAYLKAIIPGAWTLAIGVGDYTAEVVHFVLAVEEAARKSAIPMRKVDFRDMDAAQADGVLKAMRGQGIRVLSHWATIAGTPDDDYALLFATTYGLVTAPSTERDVAKGALLSYAALGGDTDERKAVLLARILRGAAPGGIPFETPRHYRLSVNRRTAGLLKLTIPREVLLRAERVFD